jgi:hypothetical protein
MLFPAATTARFGGKNDLRSFALITPITRRAKRIAEAARALGVAIAAQYGRDLGEVTLKPAHSRQE